MGRGQRGSARGHHIRNDVNAQAMDFEFWRSRTIALLPSIRLDVNENFISITGSFLVWNICLEWDR